jgi:hypothetical protein
VLFGYVLLVGYELWLLETHLGPEWLAQLHVAGD